MKTEIEMKEVADIEDNFSQWYSDVVLKAKMADYGPAKGTMIIREWGYAVWEHLQAEMNRRILETGHKNVYFPTLIPLSYFQREAEHVEGFAPELAMVERIGKEKLAEPLVLRPTSETIICEAFSKWLKSYKDLPIKINQWANIFRMEKTTRPFLRTTEFLWQEGHTLHRTAEEAIDEAKLMLKVYVDFCAEYLALPMFNGLKSQKEKFAGAEWSLTIEAMMRDGKSLQSGTSHYLGTRFAQAFDIKYLDSDGKLKQPHQTSWGISTRLIGAIIMVHGDDRGLRLPPAVAPTQVIIVPVQQQKGGVIDKCKALAQTLKKSFRVEVDETDNTPGWKFSEWEMKGVPVRVECGPRDIEAGQVVVVRRDLCTKEIVKEADLEAHIAALLPKIHAELLKQATEFKEARIKEVKTIAELKKAVDEGNFAVAGFCDVRECEDKIKAETNASTRCYLEEEKDGTCICCGKKTKKQIYFAKNY